MFDFALVFQFPLLYTMIVSTGCYYRSIDFTNKICELFMKQFSHLTSGDGFMLA